MKGQARPLNSPTPWTLHEMRTCFTIRDANNWGVCQLSFGYTRETKELRRNDAERIIRAVNGDTQHELTLAFEPKITPLQTRSPQVDHPGE